MGMFDFLNMSDNYEDRKVARFESNDCIIDTASVNDSTKPYETAISHKKYNEAKWIIVELYDTKEQALSGHNKWMEIMKQHPDKLIDVSTAEIKTGFGIGDIEYKRED